MPNYHACNALYLPKCPKEKQTTALLIQMKHNDEVVGNMKAEL
jgi:hypothetical protein